MKLLTDVKSYLESNGFQNVFINRYPDKPDAVISLHEREYPLAFGFRGINYGVRTAKVSVRIRSTTDSEASSIAWDIFSILDSGGEENAIELTPERLITARPSPPYYFEQDTKNRITYMLKVSITTPIKE